ncbi:hypothetical protein Tco_1523228 [Tanacetum coccineum]
MLNLSNMLFFFQFISKDALDAMLENGPWSSYARAMIELRADVKLKDTVMVAMPKLVAEGFYICTVHIEYEWKPPRNNARSSGKKKQVVVVSKDVKNSNPFDVLNSVEKDDDLGKKMMAGKGPSSKIDSEVEDVVDDHAVFMSSIGLKRGVDSSYDDHLDEVRHVLERQHNCLRNNNINNVVEVGVGGLVKENKLQRTPKMSRPEVDGSDYESKLEALLMLFVHFLLFPLMELETLITLLLEKEDLLDYEALRNADSLDYDALRRINADSLDYDALRRARVSEISEAISERGMNNLLADRMMDNGEYGETFLRHDKSSQEASAWNLFRTVDNKACLTYRLNALQEVDHVSESIDEQPIDAFETLQTKLNNMDEQAFDNELGTEGDQKDDENRYSIDSPKKKVEEATNFNSTNSETNDNSSDLSRPPRFEFMKKSFASSSNCSTSFTRHRKNDIK